MDQRLTNLAEGSVLALNLLCGCRTRNLDARAPRG